MSKGSLKLVKNAGILLSGDTIATFLGAFFFLYIARTLGLRLFGKYSFLQNTIMILSVVTTFGFSQVIVKSIAGKVYSEGSVLTNVVVTRFFLVFLAVIILNLYFLILRYPSEMILLGNLFILVLFPRAFVESVRSVFQAVERMFPVSSLLVAARILLIILGIIAVEYGLGIRGIICAHVVSMLFISAICIYVLRANHIKLEKVRWERSKKLLRQAVPFGLAGLLAQLYFRIDIQMLEPMSGVEAVGTYNSAYQFISVMVLLPGAISKAVFPRLTDLFGDRKNSFELMIKSIFPVLGLIALLVVIPFYIYAEEIINLTFGDSYYESHQVLQILIWALIPISFNNILNVALFSSNLQRYVTWNSVICVLLNITLNWFLIPILSYRGAALATVITEATLLFLLLFWLNRYLFSYFPVLWFCRVLFMAVFLSWGLMFLKDISVYLSFVGMVLTIPLLILIILPKNGRKRLPSLLSFDSNHEER